MQTFYDVTNGAERSDGKHVFAKLVEIFVRCLRLLAHVRVVFNRSKRARAAAASGVPLHAFDGGIEHSFVRRELLQGANAAAGANDRHEITRLHLFIDKLFQGAPHKVSTFKRQPEIVNNDGDRATNFFGA